MNPPKTSRRLNSRASFDKLRTNDFRPGNGYLNRETKG